MNIFNLQARMTLDKSEYDKGIADAKKQNAELEKDTKKMSASSLISWAAIGAAIIGVANKMKDLVYNTTEYAGSIKDLAQVYETTYQNVQELNYIAQESGKNAEWLLRKAQSSGESYAEIVGLTNEEYQEMIANAHELGLVMENEVIDRADMLGDKLSQLSYQWQAVLTGLLAGNEGAEENLRSFFQRLFEAIEEFTPNITQFVVRMISEVAVAFVRYVPKIVIQVISQITATLVANLPELFWEINKAVIQGLIDIILAPINWIIELFGGKSIGENLLGVGSSFGEVPFSPQGADYEITEKVDETLTIHIESDGVTANDKVVASSIEDLIDQKLGAMIGGI